MFKLKLLLLICYISLPGLANTNISHAIAMHGEPKYKKNFENVEYVNADAFKGGEVVFSSIGTFDTFNPFTLKGDSVSGIGNLFETLTKLDISGADALFVSCTALPVLEILNEVEKKINKPVFSSNQTLIWDTIISVGYKSPVDGYGKLLRNKNAF